MPEFQTGSNSVVAYRQKIKGSETNVSVVAKAVPSDVSKENQENIICILLDTVLLCRALNY